MRLRVRRNLTKGKPGIIKDQLVVLTGKHKGVELRRIEAWVEIDGEWRRMVFMTNNLDWSPRTVCDLNRRRWDIEVFCKQVKQTLKLSNFLGHSANAVRWQVYAALLVYVLLRFQAYLTDWGHSFTRLFTVTRSTLWERLDPGPLPSGIPAGFKTPAASLRCPIPARNRHRILRKVAFPLTTATDSEPFDTVQLRLVTSPHLGASAGSS